MCIVRGTQAAHVDYLSRNPVECLAVDIKAAEWIKVAQIQDHDIEVIRKILKSSDRQPEGKQYFEKYDLKGVQLSEESRMRING